MTTTLTNPDTSIGAPVTASPADEPVSWRVLSPVPGRVTVSVRRTGPVDHLIPQLRAGRIASITTRVDAPREDMVAAVGLSGHNVAPGDPESVARAVLAGYDQAGTTGVHHAVMAMCAVHTGDPTAVERARYRELWPDPARHDQCRTAVASLIRTTRWEVS
jgi:hypothetical protein